MALESFTAPFPSRRVELWKCQKSKIAHFIWMVYRLISRVIVAERVVKLGKEAIRDDGV